MAEDRMPLPHKLILNERNKLSMTGVTEVVSFDENIVTLHTGSGALHIHGEGLQLKTLSPEGGQVAVDGKVSAIVYEEQRHGGSWLSRLLK